MEIKKFRIVTRCFGYPMYMSSAALNLACHVTDKLSEAEEFIFGDDNPKVKAKFMAGVTGLDGWTVEAIN